MDYENYIKGKYMKMAMKGVKIPFPERWESALIAMQCIFSINVVMNNNAVKLLEGIPDEFVEKFSNGQPLDYDGNSRKYIELFLRAQNYMQTISNFTLQNYPKLSEIIFADKSKIDIGIYKYCIGNKSVVENYGVVAREQAQSINNSLNASFKDKSEYIVRIREDMDTIFMKTSSDLAAIVGKFAYALDMEDIIKV
jgi:transcription termination factor NusB